MSRRSSMIIGDAPPSEKKRRWSLFRGRTSEPVVTLIPVEDSPRSHLSPSSPRSSTSEACGSSSQGGSIRSALLTSVNEASHDGLPSYASATSPSAPTTYTFRRTSPFAMVLSPQTSATDSDALYHIGVGVNVWMPSLTVTTVRRGPREDGPIAATLE